MEKQSNFETFGKPIAVLVVICLICSALLAVTNNVTAPIIAENELKTTNAAYIEVLPEGTTSEQLTPVDVTDFAEQGVASAVTTADGAFAIKATAAGYDGGLITIIMGIDADGTILGVYSDSSTQTAGMGSKCDAEMTPQISNTGKTADQPMVLNTDVDQVSGCTVSSVAYVKAVNCAIDCFNFLKGGN